MNNKRVLFGLVLLAMVLAACGRQAGTGSGDGTTGSQIDSDGNASAGGPARDYRIVTLLPRDTIPAIDNPEFLTASEADSEYSPDEQVIGISFNGQTRAYSISLLSSQEIVNDEVGGVKIAVTW